MILACSQEELIGKRRFNEGGTLPAIIFCRYMPLSYFSVICNGRILCRLLSSCSRDDCFGGINLSEPLKRVGKRFGEV